jgi:Xaa-Pro aminopeptidase
MRQVSVMIPSAEVQDRLERFRGLTPGSVRVVHGRSNVRYLTGYDGGGFTPWLVITDSDLLLVHYSADEDSVAAHRAVQLVAQPFSPADDPLQALRDAVGAPRTGVVADLGWWRYDEVRDLGVDMADCSEALRVMRVVKSPWEQDRLRDSGLITSATMDRLEDLARSGASGRSLAVALYESVIGLGSGPFTAIPYLAVGGATFENHTTWDWADTRGEPELPASGDYLLEFATSVEGYGAPLSRSGSSHPAAATALKAIEAGIEKIKESLRPGANGSALHSLMQSSIEAAGFHFSHRAGYSVGLGETETWMEANLALLGPLASHRIEEGMAFHVVGSIVEPGSFGVARSNCVLVTSDGCEVLTA